MHADLVKLLDLQAKDSAVAEVERRLGALRAETGVLDQALDKRARRPGGGAAGRGRRRAATGRAGGQDRELPRAPGAAPAAAGARAEPEGGLHPDGRAGPGEIGGGEGGERLGPQRRCSDPGSVQGGGGGAQRRRGRRGAGPGAGPAGGAAGRSWRPSWRRRSRSGRRARPSWTGRSGSATTGSARRAPAT